MGLRNAPRVTLGTLLAGGVILVAAPLLWLGIYLLAQLAGNARDSARQSLVNNTRLLAAIVDNEINAHLAVSSSVAALQSINLSNPDVFRAQVTQALSPLPGTWLSIFDPSGALLQSTIVDVRQPQPPRGARDVMERAWQTREPQLSNLVTGNITGRQSAFVEYPVFKDGMPWYSIVIGISPERFRTIIDTKFEADAVVGIVDGNLNFVARVPGHETRVGTAIAPAWSNAIARASSGVYEGATLEGIRTLTAYERTRDGWTVGIGRPVAALDRPVRAAISKLVALGLLSVLLSFLIGLALWLKLRQAMTDLVGDARMLGAGEPVVERQGFVTEAVAINHAMSTASQALALRDRELVASHDSFRHLVTHSPFGIYTVDADFRLSKVSDGAQKVFKNVRPLIGRNFEDVLRTVWPEPLASGFIARFRHTLETGEAYHSPRLVHQRQDIEEVEAYDWKIERVLLPDGRPGVVCHFYDLTERQRQEEHVRMLMLEVDHRSKNILALVQSIAQHTASREPKDFVVRFEERIRALAASHDVLVRNGWKSIPLKELLGSQLGHFKGSHEQVRITFDGPDFGMTASSAQTIGMAIHELATNAGKYGALSNDTGEVHITWTIGADAPHPFAFQWHERGGPPVEQPDKRGFGWMVVCRQPKMALDAVVSLDYDRDGVVWRLECLLEKVAEDAASAADQSGKS